jgi:hypothetical protein
MARPAGKKARLDRPRRTLEDTVPTPPSSLNLERRGSAARTGRAELEQDRQVHGSMTRGITGGDVDVNLEQAYFTGDEAPGGDNPTPDQDVVEDIGARSGSSTRTTRSCAPATRSPRATSTGGSSIRRPRRITKKESRE